MFFWAMALVMAAILWGVETYLRKQDEKEQSRLRAQAQRQAAAKRAAAEARRYAVKRTDRTDRTN